MVASAAAATNSVLKWTIMGEGKGGIRSKMRRESRKERGDGKNTRGKEKGAGGATIEC